MRKGLHILCFWLLGLALIAQQDPMYSMYMFNGHILNPAYAGSREQGSLTLLHRQQWAGLEGGPSTQSFSFHAPTPDLHHGWGVAITHDAVGFTERLNADFTYAYRLHLGKQSSLALGLLGGFNYYRTQLSQIATWDPQDPAFAQGDVRKVLPNAGTGLYFNSKKAYAGISMPNILPATLHDPYFDALISQRDRPVFATAGVVVRLTDWVKLKPSILAKYSRGSGVHMDYNASLLFKDILWVGASFRPKQAWVLMAEVNLTPYLRLGYAYDQSMGQAYAITQPSHEFMVGIDLAVKKGKMVNPRLF